MKLLATFIEILLEVFLIFLIGVMLLPFFENDAPLTIYLIGALICAVVKVDFKILK